MGQVPISKSHHIGIIGRGRAAKHLSFYFESMGLSLLKWDRSQGQAKLKPLVDCSVVFLAIPDSQVDAFLFDHSWLLKTEVIHLSGALSTTIRGLHPLVSFEPELFDLNFYKQIPFVVEMETPFEFKKYLPIFPLNAPNW